MRRNARRRTLSSRAGVGKRDPGEQSATPESAESPREARFHGPWTRRGSTRWPSGTLFSWDDAFMHGGPFAVLADRCAPIRATRQRIRPLKKEQKVYTFGSQRRSPPPQSGDSPTGHYVEARPLCSPSFKAAADAPWTVRGARRSVRADPLRRLSRVGSVVADFIASIIGSPALVSAPIRRFPNWSLR